MRTILSTFAAHTRKTVATASRPRRPAGITKAIGLVSFSFVNLMIADCSSRKLRTAERLVNLIAIFCIESRRIFWLTMLNRTDPNAPPNLALTKVEIRLLDHLMPDKSQPPDRRAISWYIIKIARLGGYLARRNDSAPGNIVLWRGLSRLSDIELGAFAGASICG